MVRIQDSQSWHRGSIPLSTTLSLVNHRFTRDSFILLFNGILFVLVKSSPFILFCKRFSVPLHFKSTPTEANDIICNAHFVVATSY